MSKLRVLFGGIVTFAYVIFMAIWSRVLPQLQGIVSAQSLNDDSVMGNALYRWFASGDLIGLVVTLVAFGLLVWIFWPALKKLGSMNSMLTLVTGLVVASMLLSACAVRASNESEGSSLNDVIQILPNQTAFKIPATGGNLSGQEQFGSIEYLDQNKVPAKRVEIEKELIGGKWVPKVFIILVDRTPVARQWTESTDTGTTATNEALCAESIESINVCFQISMAAAVKERDAATYLYNFPTTQLQNEQVGGVFVATPLSAVVDNQIRQYLQSFIGAETGKRTLEQIIAEKSVIVTAGEEASKEYFAKQGITIAYIGLGGPLELDPEVQEAINAIYVAQKQIEVARLHATKTVLDAQAAAEAARIKAEADAQAIAQLSQAVGGDASKLAPALESYRWNGSRVTVMLAPDTPAAVEIPQPTQVPAEVPTAVPTPSQ